MRPGGIEMTSVSGLPSDFLLKVGLVDQKEPPRNPHGWEPPATRKPRESWVLRALQDLIQGGNVLLVGVVPSPFLHKARITRPFLSWLELGPQQKKTYGLPG